MNETERTELARKHLGQGLDGAFLKNTLALLTEFESMQNKAINFIPCCTELKTAKENKTLELQNELNRLNEDLEFEMDEPQVYKIGRLILEEKIKLLSSF